MPWTKSGHLGHLACFGAIRLALAAHIVLYKFLKMASHQPAHVKPNKAAVKVKEELFHAMQPLHHPDLIAPVSEDLGL